MIKIYIMGEMYEVPEGLTIMKSLEYAGFKLIRGSGCRGGFCGACSTIYRKENDYKLYTALACQTPAEDGMYLVQIPFVPANKSIYNLDKLSADVGTILQHYPEIARCVGCNTCTKACPQELQVMDYIQLLLRGDITKSANLSFDCIQCGLCAVRCPADIAHYHVAQLARRLYGKYLAPKSKELMNRVEEIKKGKFDLEMSKIVSLPIDELKRLYTNRDIEK
jgi:succinate dehydrogenase/fumarate reductase-like Fe-S protein